MEEKMNVVIPQDLRCVYICPFLGTGGTQEYTFMLASKMLAYNRSLLIMPFDVSQESFRINFLKLGGEILELPKNVCDAISKKNYLSRWIAGKKIIKLLADRGWLNEVDRLVLHSNISPQTFVSLMRGLPNNSIGINTFHDFGDLAKRSISYIPNTLSFFLMPRKRIAFITPSHSIAQQLTKFVACFISKKVHVINTGITPTELRGAKTFIPPQIRIGMLGRVASAKAWDIWLHAISKFNAQNNAVFFDWFGDGPDLQKAKKLAHDLGVDKVVFFHGFVKDSLEALDKMDIFVLSSRWEGGCLPRSVLEAMFRGIPCVLPRLPSILESIKDCECCILYTPEDYISLKEALELATINLDRLDYLAHKARLHVEKKHTSEFEFSKTVELYKILINQ